MENKIIDLFKDKPLVEKIQKRLPYLFQLAELESSRAGKIGVEITDTAMKQLINNSKTMKIIINWKKEIIDFKPFAKWVELWQKN
jgi:hypothetical protein